MKLKLAIGYAKRINEKLNNLTEGTLELEGCEYKKIKVEKVWVFGSTIKGSLFPNDLDLLIKSTKFDLIPFPERLNAKDSTNEFFKGLSKGMKKVSRHDWMDEITSIDKLVEIWPKFELDEFNPSASKSNSRAEICPHPESKRFIEIC